MVEEKFLRNQMILFYSRTFSSVWGDDEPDTAEA